MSIKTLVEMKVRELLNIEQEELDQSEDLTSYGLDSIQSVNLIIELEVEFDITFEDEELLFDNFTTVEKIVAIINGKINN